MLQPLLCTAVALLTLFSASPVFAQSVGSIASLEGLVEIGREGSFSSASVGSEVFSGDTIRTGDPGRARIVFQDESVLNLGDSSNLRIDESVFNPNEGTVSTIMKLFSGKVRAIVSDYYGEPGAKYEIETPNSVSGVRGTEFVVDYEPGTTVTSVLGLGGRVAVNGAAHPDKGGVMVEAREITTIEGDGFPTPPRQLDVDDDRYRRLLAGLEMPGGGVPESLFENDPLLRGDSVPAQDRAAARAAGGSAVGDPNRAPDTPTVEREPDEPAHAPGDKLDQPTSILTAPTDLEIRF